MAFIKSWVILVLLLTTLSACASTEHDTAPFAGTISSQALLSDYPHFSAAYQQYTVNKQQQKQINAIVKPITLTVYFGTWCHDSQREVPRILKLFAKHPNVTIKLVALDYQKSEPQGLAKKAGVKYTPTIIVSRNGKELKRFIERPNQDWAADIAVL